MNDLPARRRNIHGVVSCSSCTGTRCVLYTDLVDALRRAPQAGPDTRPSSRGAPGWRQSACAAAERCGNTGGTHSSRASPSRAAPRRRHRRDRARRMRRPPARHVFSVTRPAARGPVLLAAAAAVAAAGLVSPVRHAAWRRAATSRTRRARTRRQSAATPSVPPAAAPAILRAAAHAVRSQQRRPNPTHCPGPRSRPPRPPLDRRGPHWPRPARSPLGLPRSLKVCAARAPRRTPPARALSAARPPAARLRRRASAATSAPSRLFRCRRRRRLGHHLHAPRPPPCTCPPSRPARDC